MRLVIVALLLISQSTLSAADEDAEGQLIQVVVGVLAQADRIPPEFSEQAEEKLKAMPPTALPHLLRLMNQLPPTTVEKLNQCGGEIIRRAKAESLEIPQTYLQKFAESDRQDPSARRIALGWLDINAPGERETFLLQHLSDSTFRRDAIDVLIKKAAMPRGDHKEEPIKLLKTAFAEVRDLDQAEQLVSALKEHGITVSPEKHLGVVHQWTCESTIETPVTKPGSLRGLETIPVRLERKPSELFTHVVLKQQEQASRIVVRSVIHSDSERDVQLRITCNRTPRLHLNGEEFTLIPTASEICGHKDQTSYTRPIHLLRGGNEIAFKFPDPERTTGESNDVTDFEFCVCLVDDNGRGLHAPQVESRTKVPAIRNPK